MFALPPFRPGLDGSNYLGVSSANHGLLSPIEGTSLTLFGMQIDLADFMSEDIDGIASLTSYESIRDTVLKHDSPTPPPHADLPRTYEECANYSRIYLATVNPWLPLLHRPDFEDLVCTLGLRPRPFSYHLLYRS